METEKLRKEYEAKLANMKSSYEAELMSKQKLQEEMERLQSEYDRRVQNVEQKYSAAVDSHNSNAVVTVHPAGVGSGHMSAGNAISMIALANEQVSLGNTHSRNGMFMCCRQTMLMNYELSTMDTIGTCTNCPS